ncbi:hypothetical protein DTO164E3_4183 [Paecilomyces variotii]|nr:hypothetical protein DTO032I3_7293 [Paecilomyces variotii]KAJ9200172.1 hypothetical protein DTO164E3_4183 [Paecilomyces variotii]KAJ9281892.1 hypothetical protein DTO021D3_1188 [Paecilomyces variotii]KAJ9287576.1 hypothetical protein DTO021C3_4869 [Paecilomyces variotii]KAJ9347363.1 hypothetical protein DTO027B6_237 [Paecilomyces variotii]
MPVQIQGALSPPVLLSNFQKEGESATFSSGYPKQWGEELKTFAFDKRINSASLTHDEKFLALGVGQDILIYDVATFRVIETLRGPVAEVGYIQFAPEGFSSRHGGYMLVSDTSSTVRSEPLIVIWYLNANGGSREKQRSIDVQLVTAGAVDRAFEILSTLDPSDNWSRSEEAVSLLETRFRNTIEEAARLHNASRQVLISKATFPGFGSVVFSPDGCRLLYKSVTTDERAGRQEQVMVYDVASRKNLLRLEGHTGAIVWAGYSPNGRHIASSSWDQTLKVYSAENGTLLRSYGHTGGQNWGASFSPDSRFIAVGTGSRKVFIWEVNDPQATAIEINGFPAWVRSLDWSPDSKLLAAGGRNGKLVVFNIHTKQTEQVWQIDKENSGLGFVEINDIRWLNIKSANREESREVLAFNPGNASLLIYDFDTNQELYFGPKADSPWSPGYWHSTIKAFYRSGLIGSIDQDGKMRVWKLPFGVGDFQGNN